MKTISVFVLSYERPELLACALGSICGMNSGPWAVTVVDDASKDPRVDRLINAYRDRGLVQNVVKAPSRGGIGRSRRVMIEEFLKTGADQLVQVEGDMVIAPGAIRALVDAYDGLAVNGFPVPWLNTHNHDWCHIIKEVRQVGPYKVGLAKSNSEPFWTMSRKAVADNLHLIPAERPDLVVLLQTVGAAVLFDPQIKAQHLGACHSICYPEFHWSHVVYHDNDGKQHDQGRLRQPIPGVTINFPVLIDGYPQSIVDLYRTMVRQSGDVLPPFPQ